jgi:hypothetical protein
MNTKSFCITFVFLILLNNCKKEESCPQLILAGVANNCILSTAFDPGKEIENSGYDYYTESFAIDIDNDEIYDINYSIDHYSYCGGESDGCKIYVESLNNDVSILEYNNSPKIMYYADTLNNQNKWESKKYLLTNSNYYCSGYYSQGVNNWNTGYMGIKIKNKFGWVKFEVASDYKIIIYEYGIEK